jgi:hypothetical protein
MHDSQESWQHEFLVFRLFRDKLGYIDDSNELPTKRAMANRLRRIRLSVWLALERTV